MARRRSPTAAERALWGAAMRDVRPLDPMATPPVFPPLPEPAPILEIVPPSPAPVAPRVGGSVDRATVERLKRGQVNVEARIDLHGLTQDAARIALTGFVERAAADGWRAVLVITGKGVGGDGVLRRRVPDWLAEAPIRAHVAGVSEAHRRHGGEGALYVALKRVR